MAARKTTKRTKAKATSRSNVSTRTVKASPAPKLPTWQWVLSGLVGLLFLLMAVLQLISFNDFKDNLATAGLAGPTAWAVVIILAELWASVGFFRLPLSNAFRYISYGLAVLVSGFWFVYNMQLVSTGIGQQLSDSGFFGRFLRQSPGWWSAVEVTLVLFLVLLMVSELRDNRQNKR